jgi:hypothetical protein
VCPFDKDSAGYVELGISFRFADVHNHQAFVTEYGFQLLGFND